MYQFFHLAWILCNDHCKFISTNSVYLSILMKAVSHAICRCAYKFISGGMSKRIIYVFETVDIHGNIDPFFMKIKTVYGCFVSMSVKTFCEFIGIRCIDQFLFFIFFSLSYC